MSSVFIPEMHSNQCYCSGKKNQLVEACLDEIFKLMKIAFRYFYLLKVRFYKVYRLNLVVICIKFV